MEKIYLTNRLEFDRKNKVWRNLEHEKKAVFWKEGPAPLFIFPKSAVRPRDIFGWGIIIQSSPQIHSWKLQNELSNYFQLLWVIPVSRITFFKDKSVEKKKTSLEIILVTSSNSAMVIFFLQSLANCCLRNQTIQMVRLSRQIIRTC